MISRRTCGVGFCSRIPQKLFIAKNCKWGNFCGSYHQGRRTFSIPSRRAFLASLTSSATVAGLAACSGAGNVLLPGSQRQSLNPDILCAQQACGSPTGSTAGKTFECTEGQYVSMATAGSNYTFQGSATASGVNVSTSSGAADVATGLSTITGSVNGLTPSPITFSYLDVTALRTGTNSLPRGVLSIDSATGDVSATVTDANGIAWTVTGALQSDGKTVDVTATSSRGTVQTSFDGSAYAPYASSSSLATATAHRASISRTTSHDDIIVDWAAVAVVAACVAAGAGLVASVAVVVPGGQLVAGVAGIVAGVAGCVAAGAGAVAFFHH